MSGRLHISTDGRAKQGFVLLEIMAAVALVGIFVSLLGTAVQRACDASLSLRDKAITFSATSSERSCEEAWGWGPRIESITWSPGPKLVITTGEDCAVGGEIGAWADGWQVGEWSASSATQLEVGGATWDGLAGGELIVRARAGEGPWGPPYRTVVPDAYGNVAVARANAFESESPASNWSDAGTAVHSRCLGISSLAASWVEEPVSETIHDLIQVLMASTCGLCSVDCGGRVQSWISSEGRSIDVYW